jgi:hypothetical protein
MQIRALFPSPRITDHWRDAIPPAPIFNHLSVFPRRNIRIEADANVRAKIPLLAYVASM